MSRPTTVLYEGQRNAEHMISEAEHFRSRDEVTVEAGAASSGARLEPGTVLGKRTADGVYVIYDPGNADGSETVAGVLWEDCFEIEQKAVHTRQCQVKAVRLNWFSGATGGQITTGIEELAALGIIAR